MNPVSWQQSNVTFSNWPAAEQAAIAHLMPVLARARHDGLVSAWFFLRKAPSWRIRYLPRSEADHQQMRHRLQLLAHAKRTADIAQVTEVVYEPEVHAFGGGEAMEASHRLFHHDSHQLLTYLAEVRPSGVDRRRELALLLGTALLRAAHLDWYEQGDVWARVAQHREVVNPPSADAARVLTSGIRRLMSVDITNPMHTGAPLEFAADWAEVYRVAGAELSGLAATGRLHRGLRAVLAHHLVFAFNRFGLPYATQAVLADAAKSVVFGADPTTDHGEQGEASWTLQAPI